MWIEKLSKDELLELHRTVISDTQSIDIEEYKEGICVTAYENWPYEDGTPAYVPTEYKYYDYDYIDYDTSDTDHTETVRRYREFLIKKFGKKYICSMVKELLSVDIAEVIEQEC